ncbi:hypothetical protein AWW66_25835 [Micromonospora rosaria]|uniref:Uncharacterized protein n=1 Tax=Micromonospora rosaria TaxID=47874 RepID=A0A136PL60_9ACTN|nr:hypothetical protein [Micromonospora rosaria]KXK59149.1 hypothetical protein AWW66_25835 [Micromonospora rosaria]
MVDQVIVVLLGLSLGLHLLTLRALRSSADDRTRGADDRGTDEWSPRADGGGPRTGERLVSSTGQLDSVPTSGTRPAGPPVPGGRRSEAGPPARHRWATLHEPTRAYPIVRAGSPVNRPPDVRFANDLTGRTKADPPAPQEGRAGGRTGGPEIGGRSRPPGRQRVGDERRGGPWRGDAGGRAAFPR